MRGAARVDAVTDCLWNAAAAAAAAAAAELHISIINQPVMVDGCMYTWLAVAEGKM